MPATNAKGAPAYLRRLLGWKTELLFALPLAGLVVWLFYTWFGVLDRYQVFLYFHDMGAGFDTSPFGRVTVSRYWMSGLVAGGAVMVAYAAALLVLGRVCKGFRAPVWWRLWVLCACPLAIAIPVIVMTVNDPVLPLINAAQVTAMTLLGLALALYSSQTAARQPAAYLLLMIDGVALAGLLMSLKELEDVNDWLAQGRAQFLSALGFGLAAGLGLLVTMTLLRWWRRLQPPEATAWYAAGLAVHYLFLPLYHLAWCSDLGCWTDPGYYIYISDSDNYFARSSLLQVGVWLALALLVLGVTRLRVRLHRQRGAPRP